jgi:Big-like domain-containing protein
VGTGRRPHLFTADDQSAAIRFLLWRHHSAESGRRAGFGKLPAIPKPMTPMRFRRFLIARQAVTLKATVTGQYGGAASGTVMFKQGTTVLATVPVVDSSATYSNTFPQRGTFGMSAVYSGDNNLKTSTSKPVWQVVRRYSTTTSVTSASNPSVYGQIVTLTAKVESGAPGGPTGKVTFRNAVASSALSRDSSM